MKNIKIALTGLAIAGVAVGSFIKWSSSSSRIEAKALDLYLHGHNRESYEKLATLDTRLPVAHLLLYQGYTLRDNQLISRSSQRFQQAITLLKDKKVTTKYEQSILFELGLNLALNGYLTKDQNLYNEGLETAKKIQDQHPWVLALEALDAEAKGNFILASNLAQKSNTKAYLSGWMAKPFSKVFTSNWSLLLEIRKLIEESKFTLARDKLAQITQHEPSVKNRVQLLMGLSYMYESQKKPVEVSLAYIKLASAYFKNLDLTESTFQTDREKITEVFQQLALRALKTGMTDDLNFYVEAFTFWKDEISLMKIADAYVDTLVSTELSGDSLPIITSSNAKLTFLIQSPEWQNKLHESVVTKLRVALDKQQWDSIQKFWSATSANADTTPQLIAKIADTIENYIQDRLKGLIKDIAHTDASEVLDPVFRELRQVLPILAQIEFDDVRYQNFLQKLVDDASILVNSPEISPAADEVFSMLLDSTSSPQPERLKIMIKDKISKRFWQANYLKDVETMIRIFEIAEKINLDAIPTYTPEAIANLVADASYMLDSDQIKAAQSQLRWVLKLSSQNIQARLLLGSSYFASGNYTQAAQLLKEVSSPSNEMNQILAICYLRSGQGERALEVIQLLKSQSQTLSDRLLFEIGYYQALQKQWRSASDFFNSMNQKVPDVWIYLLACSYRLNDLKAVWQSYNQLPAAIRANRQITSLALRSAQTLGLAGMADSILEKSMSLISERTLITQAAQSFLEQEFAPFELDLSLVAAQYFQNEKSDPKRALSALDKKKSNKDWRISTERAKAFIQLGLYQDSLQEIEANKPQEITVESLNYWLTLSKAQRLCGQFDKSYQLIASVQSTVGLNRAIYFEKSQLFLLLMRPDLALSEIKNIIDENAVVEELMVYVECLIKSNLFEEALKYSETILQQDYSAAVTWKLAVLIWPAQVKLQKPVIAPSKNLFELLNADQKGLAIQHLINIRAFAQAQSWAEQFSNDLNQSFEGKFALLQLALMQRQNNRIPQLLQQLTDDQTTIEQHYRLLQWIEHLGQSEALEHLLKKSTDPLVALNNKDMAEMIKSFLSFLSSSAIKMDKRGILDEETTKILTVIRDQSFDHRQANGPLYFHWIHAYSCLLLAQPLRAEPDFELCTVASPAFTSAFLKLSHILLDAKHWDLAVEWAQKALLQYPNHPWVLLQIAQCKFEQFLVQSTKSSLIEEAQQNLKICLEIAPYLPEAYLLSARIEMIHQGWNEAYNQLTLADNLKPNDRDTLNLLIACIQKRIEIEGARIEWSQQLHKIKEQLIF